jgi:hypothetical protein
MEADVRPARCGEHTDLRQEGLHADATRIGATTLGVMGDPNLAADKRHEFIVDDFRATWDALEEHCRRTGSKVGGNFMFAGRALLLLELACRVCACDSTGTKLRTFGDALEAIEPRYFTLMPSGLPKPSDDWALPSSSVVGHPERQLLRAIFDLGRHGLAHLNQQLIVQTGDGRYFGLSLAGVTKGRTLTALKNDRLPNHLSIESNDDTLWLVLCPGMLFLDLEQAVKDAGIYRGSVPTLDFDRAHKYTLKAKAAEEALLGGGHPRYVPHRPS